ncbi:MAG: protoporphyrinogen oxidase [Acidobacteriota bacterium]|nr:protoporphyrinogen oxidase [Acidobacteriota bacterium]
MKKIGVIGGGISGLTAAFLLKNKGFDVRLFEKSGAAGGNIQTVEIDGFLIEYAPNSLIKSPRLVDLIKALKLEAEVLTANPNNKKRYVLRNGKLRALPMSVARMAAGGYFSANAKLRLLKEPFIKSKSPDGESVAAFFERRLGPEIVERAADPFIAGIYAGNPENLSVKAAFPRLYELEKEYGSLLIGSLRSKTEKADKNFPRSFSFVKGIQTLTDKLGESLGESVKTNCGIEQIEKTADGKWLVKSASGENVFDAIVVSTPAEAAAGLIENLDADLSAKLKDVYYPPVALVYLGIKKENVNFNLDGFGFLIPSSERRKILGTLWNSAVFENRAPEGYHLLTTFIGGSRNAEEFEKSDDELYETVYEELKSILNLSARPDFMHVKLWRKAIPQYNLSYETVEKGIEDFAVQNKGVFFCSNFYKGISVGDSVKNAYKTADEIEEFLKK